MDRRAFLGATLAVAGAGRIPPPAARHHAQTRLILLGTAGGPRPRKTRSAPAQVVVAHDTPYVVDCGDVKLAQGADILVHEALYPEGLDRLVAGVGNAADLKRSILSHHTPATDAGRVAQAAGVQTLVLSHLVPAEDPFITDQMWIDAASTHFRGRIIVGRDLLEL